ncbi:MAG: Mth938-like domain-containing protein [Alphaproteobacteria bacterium]|nr:Mth938-like domain-containing protein [Alphaproteobacteria bacterium]MCY4318746.1 Mth938-like domain-containing protein [Alphaproteobacteria bacterium]
MTDISPVVPQNRQVVESYGSRCFRISGTIWTGSVLLRPDVVLSWPVTAFREVVLESLMPLTESGNAPEILLIGCGTRAEMMSRTLRDAIRAEGMIADTMDTGAACRTYNVLVAEDRRVAAALIAVE